MLCFYSKNFLKFNKFAEGALFQITLHSISGMYDSNRYNLDLSNRCGYIDVDLLKKKKTRKLTTSLASLVREKLKWYHCESDISLFNLRLT